MREKVEAVCSLEMHPRERRLCLGRKWLCGTWRDKGNLPGGHYVEEQPRLDEAVAPFIR